MLLPPDLRDWVAEDDMVHFVIVAVNGMRLTAGDAAKLESEASVELSSGKAAEVLVFDLADD